ncbi:ShlB/FhaC/HecB family hemolysin secretion/activation protein [Bowmanella pacifica]|nr:ShlB/FhaC/HecB family hemolysin secretion/activation protein [Bowmanella pacifica]
MSKRLVVLNRRAMLLLACMAVQGQAVADQANSAGSALRDLQPLRVQAPPEPPQALSSITLANTPVQDDGQLSVTLKAFKFTGNSAFSQEQLSAQLQDLLGQPLTLTQLYAAAERISLFYREQGWLLARALLPAQEISDETLLIQVLEGRFDKVRLHNDSSADEQVIRRAMRGLEEGDGIRVGPLENALMNIDALPGTQVGSRLSAGDELGTSYLDLFVQEAPWLQGTMSLDNYGNTYNGAHRLNLGLLMANPFGGADAIQFQALVSDEGQLFVSSGYELPVGPWNTRVGAQFSWLQYRLGKAFKALDSQGRATSASAFVSHSWWQQRSWGLSSWLEWRYRELTDEQMGLVSEKRLNSLVFDILSGYWRDSWWGDSANSYRLSLSHGQLTLLSPYAQAADLLNTAGSYNKVALVLLRQQALSRRLSLQLNLRGQLADKNLDASEKLSLGGAYGVRAFPQGEAAGDEGWLASAELRYRLNPDWQLAAFVDAGGIRYNKDPVPGLGNQRSLKAAGVGAYWQPSADWQVSINLARALGDEMPVSDDDPQDMYVWGLVQRRF